MRHAPSRDTSNDVRFAASKARKYLILLNNATRRLPLPRPKYLILLNNALRHATNDVLMHRSGEKIQRRKYAKSLTKFAARPNFVSSREKIPRA
jgi:hypothetical protein